MIPTQFIVGEETSACEEASILTKLYVSVRQSRAVLVF
jgi:hypothetical protein